MNNNHNLELKSTNKNPAECITIVFAAGNSKRFKKDKLLTEISGKSILNWCIDACIQGEQLSNTQNSYTLISKKIIILSPNRSYTHKEFEVVRQNDITGTGGALIEALKHLKETATDLDKEVKLIVTCGDLPCLTPEIISQFYSNDKPGMTIGSYIHYSSNHQYGIIKLDENNTPCKIIEHSHRQNAKEKNNEEHLKQNASECDQCCYTSIQMDKNRENRCANNMNIASSINSQDKIYPSKTTAGDYVNAGVYCFNISLNTLLSNMLELPTNKSGEIYLTDLIELFYNKNIPTHIQSIPYSNAIGVNTISDFYQASQIINQRLIDKAIQLGAFIHNPQTVTLKYDTILEEGCEIYPNVYFGPGAHILSSAVIYPFSMISNSKIAGQVGPFAHIRDGTITDKNTQIGSFVETKDLYMQEGSKAKHLAYLGNCNVGTNSNIGAGVITCNFNGREKNKTTIGNNSDIGANTCLIAPVIVGDGSQTGAGSIISKAVPDNMLSVSRTEQKILRRIFSKKCDCGT